MTAGGVGVVPRPGVGSPVSPQVPVHVPPVEDETNARVVQVAGTVTGGTGENDAGLKLLGAYPKASAHEAGTPPAWSTQPKPSVGALVVVQLDPHDTSLCPATFSHWPFAHCALLVQKHPWLAAVQVPAAVLQPPLAQPCEHPPDWHVEGEVQVVPQPPQLLLSLCSSTQAPPQGE